MRPLGFTLLARLATPVAIVGWTHLAAAQSTAPAPTTTPVPATSPVQPAKASPTPAAPESAAPVDAAAGPHLRAGLDLASGYFIPASIVDFELAGRLGVKFTPLVAAYVDLGYTLGASLGVSASSSGASEQASTVGFWHAALMGEVTAGDRFFAAAGPLLAGGGWTAVSQSASSGGAVSQNATVAGSNFMPGAQVRLGLGFGRPGRNGARSQFTLALDSKLLLASVTSASQSVGAGGVMQGAHVGDTAIGFTPMLVLGWDMK